MFRRYNRWHSRFDQPDPYDGSYDLSNPQSFNRYAFVNGDPVNFVDPSGLVDSWNAFCSAQYSFSDCGGWGGVYGGYFGDGYARYQQEYGGLSPHGVESMRGYNERVANAQAGNGFRTYEEIIRDLNFDISYGYNADGSFWTYFNIGVTIGDPYHPFNFLGSGTLDQWPPASPGRGPFGWPEPSGPPTVRLPEGIRTTPTTGEPGIRVDPNYVNQPRVNPSDPRLTNLSIWQKIVFFISAGARVIGNVGGRITVPSPISWPAYKNAMCQANPGDPSCYSSLPNP